MHFKVQTLLTEHFNEAGISIGQSLFKERVLLCFQQNVRHL